MRHFQNSSHTFPLPLASLLALWGKGAQRAGKGLFLLLFLTSCAQAKHDPYLDNNYSFFGTWEKQTVIDLTQDVIDFSSTKLFLGRYQEFTLTKNTAGQEILVHGMFSSHPADSTSDTYFVFAIEHSGTTTPADTVIQYYKYLDREDCLLFLPAPGTSGDTIRWKRI